LVVNDYKDYLKKIGFNIDLSGNDSIIVKGIPQNQTIDDLASFFQEVIHSLSQFGKENQQYENFANTMAKLSAINHGTLLEKIEMETLFNQLFACRSYLYTPDGKKIIHIIMIKDIQKLMN